MKNLRKKKVRKKKTFRDLIRGVRKFVEFSKLSFQTLAERQVYQPQSQEIIEGRSFHKQVVDFCWLPRCFEKPVKIDVKLKISPLFWG